MRDAPLRTKTIKTTATITTTAALMLTAIVYAADLPLTVGRLVTGPTSKVELTNTGRQPITAWSLAITTQGDGRVHRVVHSRDTYLSEVTRELPGSLEELDWIRPGQSRTMTIDPQPKGATVQVLAVVMDDGTALGDAQTIASIFEHRIAERDSLEKVADAFDGVLKTKRGLAALQDLKTRLGASSPDLPTPHRAACDAVDTFLRKATAGSEEEADRSMRTYAAFVQRQYTVAAKHAKQKVGA